MKSEKAVVYPYNNKEYESALFEFSALIILLTLSKLKTEKAFMLMMRFLKVYSFIPFRIVLRGWCN